MQWNVRGTHNNAGTTESDSDKREPHTGAPYRPFTAEREPLLFQQSIEIRGLRHTGHERYDVPKPSFPTTSIVGLSQSESDSDEREPLLFQQSIY